MVLDATLSRNDTARLLRVSIADLAARVRAGELSCSELGAVRIGWRSLAAALTRDFADSPGRLKRALSDLQAIRAGLTPAAPEMSDSDPKSALTDVDPECSDSAAIAQTTERLALLLEAGRSVGGGERLSCA